METSSWIEMDDRTSYKIEGEGRVRVSSTDDVDAADVALIGQSLAERLGGTWAIVDGADGWSAASGEDDVTSVWTQEAV